MVIAGDGTKERFRKAAWYNFVGRQTASGEILDTVTATAAHRFPRNGIIGAARSGNQLWFGWTAGTDDNFIMAAASV